MAMTCVEMGWTPRQYLTQPPGSVDDIEMIIEERNIKQAEEMQNP